MLYDTPSGIRLSILVISRKKKMVEGFTTVMFTCELAYKRSRGRILLRCKHAVPAYIAHVRNKWLA